MKKSVIKAGIGLFALLVLSACATQESSVLQAEEPPKCRSNETLACDEFAGEVHNCSCEKGDNLRDMLDAYRTPDY